MSHDKTQSTFPPMPDHAVPGLRRIHSGKVRDLYDLPNPDRMLMVASDRISAFDHVLRPGVPDKGVILTQMSLWWFDQLSDLVPNHVITTDVPEQVRGRALVVEKLDMIPIECVARGYLTGSGWQEYRATQSVCGIKLPAGLENGSQLPEPIFTPATKAALGEHDENVDFDAMAHLVGEGLADQVRSLTLDIYRFAAERALERGIIVADTKFEFGCRPDGTVVLADEVLTPDSSRFWDAATWFPGGALPSFDKQFVRDWLTLESGWDPASGNEPPQLPDAVVQATRDRYLTAYRMLTGRELVGLRPHGMA